MEIGRHVMLGGIHGRLDLFQPEIGPFRLAALRRFRRRRQQARANPCRRAFDRVGSVTPTGMVGGQERRPQLALLLEDMQHLFHDYGIIQGIGFEVAEIDRAGDVTQGHMYLLKGIAEITVVRLGVRGKSVENQCRSVGRYFADRTGSK